MPFQNVNQAFHHPTDKLYVSSHYGNIGMLITKRIFSDMNMSTKDYSDHNTMGSSVAGTAFAQGHLFDAYRLHELYARRGYGIRTDLDIMRSR